MKVNLQSLLTYGELLQIYIIDKTNQNSNQYSWHPAYPPPFWDYIHHLASPQSTDPIPPSSGFLPIHNPPEHLKPISPTSSNFLRMVKKMKQLGPAV